MRIASVTVCEAALTATVTSHDPSTLLIDPDKYGSEAFGMGPHVAPVRAQRGSSFARGKAATTPSRRAGNSPQAVALSPLQGALSLDRHWPTVAWLARCAIVRPLQTSRVVRRAASRGKTPLVVGATPPASAADEHVSTPAAHPSTIEEFWKPATTVEELRELHGARQRWWGDLSAVEARRLYHQLLPTELLDDDGLPYTLAERARLAVAARHAARLYVRERALLPVSLSCELLDGVRQLLERGSFQTGGMSEEQVFEKYTRQAGLPPPPPDFYAPPSVTSLGEGGGDASAAHGELLAEEVCYTILRKACTSNERIDLLLTGTSSAGAQAAWQQLAPSSSFRSEATS